MEGDISMAEAADISVPVWADTAQRGPLEGTTCSRPVWKGDMVVGNVCWVPEFGPLLHHPDAPPCCLQARCLGLITDCSCQHPAGFVLFRMQMIKPPWGPRYGLTLDVRSVGPEAGQAAGHHVTCRQGRGAAGRVGAWVGWGADLPPRLDGWASGRVATPRVGGAYTLPQCIAIAYRGRD